MAAKHFFNTMLAASVAFAASSTANSFHKIQVSEQVRVKKIIQDIGLKPQF